MTWIINDYPNFLSFPFSNVIVIGQEKFAAGIKIILERIHLLRDSTILFLTIENMNEKNSVDISTVDSRLFQGKKQYEYAYHDDPNFRNVKTRIPPGVEEEGVLTFEPLRSMAEPVRIHLQFRGATDQGETVFSFGPIDLPKWKYERAR